MITFTVMGGQQEINPGFTITTPPSYIHCDGELRWAVLGFSVLYWELNCQLIYMKMLKEEELELKG